MYHDVQLLVVGNGELIVPPTEVNHSERGFSKQERSNASLEADEQLSEEEVTSDDQQEDVSVLKLFEVLSFSLEKVSHLCLFC